MTPFDDMLQPVDDLDRRFAEALLREPDETRAIRSEIWRLVRDIDRKIEAMHADVKDMNATCARIIDRLVRFEATGKPD